MGKYIEKPTEFEAVQISTELFMPDWFKEAVNKGAISFRFNDNSELVVDVYPLENVAGIVPMTAEFGDYVLLNPETGNLEVYTKGYFESHFQLVSND